MLLTLYNKVTPFCHCDLIRRFLKYIFQMITFYFHSMLYFTFHHHSSRVYYSCHWKNIASYNFFGKYKCKQISTLKQDPSKTRRVLICIPFTKKYTIARHIQLFIYILIPVNQRFSHIRYKRSAKSTWKTPEKSNMMIQRKLCWPLQSILCEEAIDIPIQS